jgi:TolA-binding protein
MWYTLSRLAALALVALMSGVTWAADGWWNDSWKCRRSVTLQVAGDGDKVCEVTFRTSGRTQTGGADIRVVSGIEELARKIVFSGPGDLCTIAFPVRRGMGHVWIYYDNPKAVPPKTPWEPDAGLWMETRRFSGGGAENLGLIMRTISKSQPVYGAGRVDQVFHGYNPFGPSEEFVASYKGWLVCPKDGEYEFASGAAGPSYLVIDDGIVAGRGGGGSPGRAEVSGKKTLKAGSHSFEYYTIQRNAQRVVMTAAWRVAGQGRYEAIPASAFAGAIRGKLGEYEIHNEMFAPDFSWRNMGEAFVGERPLIKMQFKDETSATTSARSWDFGDGIDSRDSAPTHIYLDPGDYKVTLRLTIRGQETACSQNVHVNRAWSEQVTRQPDTADSYAAIIKSYSFDKLSAPTLQAALLVFEEAKDWDAFGKAAREAAKPEKLAKFPADTIADVALLIAMRYRDSLRNPEGAVGVLREAEKQARRPSDKARLALEIGDTYFYNFDDVPKAQAEYLRVARQYAADDKLKVRLANIRLGDTYATQGNAPKARESYEKAEAVKVTSGGAESIASGSRAFEAEAQLRAGDLDAAYSALTSWQWEHPADKMVGEWSVLMGRWAIARKNYPEAIKHLKCLVAVNPESPSVPQALMMLADCYQQVNNAAEATACLEKLIKDYPESPLKKDAELKLQKQQAKPVRK